MSILYIVLLLVVLVLPGAAFVHGLGIKQYRYLVAITLSYAAFSITVLFARYLSLSTENVTFIAASYTGLAAVFLIISIKQFQSIQTRGLLFPACIAVVFSVYHFVAGAYSEIPSDIYYHVEKVAQVITQLESGSFSLLPSIGSAIKNDIEVWYYLLALISINANVSQGEVLESATFVSQLLFLLGVYYFSLRIFDRQRKVQLIALLSTLFVAAHFGISVFSFVRYYALAPAMLGFLFYFIVVLLWWDILRGASFKWLGTRIAGIILFTISALLVHTQEAMFIAIMLKVMLVVYYAPSFLEMVKTRSWNHVIGFDRFGLVIATLSVLGFIATYSYIHSALVHFGDIGNRLISLGDTSTLWPQLFVLNPSYQFSQVITLWGFLVYILFFVHFNKYKENLYIVSGMLLPLLTVFNPVFTDLFLRIVDSTVLWRFCFLVPIHYVAADLVCYYANKAWENRFTQKQLVFPVLLLVSIFSLLMPYFNGWQGVHFSRYPTFKSVEHKQSYQHLNDVIEFLESIPERKYLLTDPVTGYVLSGFTKHHSDRDKFNINQYSGFQNFTFDDYTNSPLSEYKDKLLVINKRTIQNGSSFVGAVSKHWPLDLFDRIEYFYPDKLLDHLRQNPKRFKLLFQQNEVMVYAL